MTTSHFKTADRTTPFLLPPSIEDWLPEDHLARFIVEIVSMLDLSPLREAYKGRGSKAYDPAVLLSLLFYGYTTKTFSSRKIEAATYDSVAFRYIAANSHPDHDTIASFRKRFLPELGGLFVQILQIAHQLDFLKIGSVSLDGTKIKANASKHKAMSWKYADKLEKAEYDEKMANRKRYEEETGKKRSSKPPKEPEPGPADKDQVNFTDEESRIMHTSGGEFEQAYNGQGIVDNESGLLVGNHVSQASNDKLELEPALKGLKDLPEELGTPENILADAGYFSRKNIERCEEDGITPYISFGREQHNFPIEERLVQPGEAPETDDPVLLMKHRLTTPEGRKTYGQRKGKIEPIFGVIKSVMGFRQFSLRGFKAIQGEWSLICSAFNLKRLHTLKTKPAMG